MAVTESELIPISALQHYAFCPRQCSLIHNEQQWEENRLTAEGRLLHERVHERETDSRCDVVICRGLRLRSFELGLSGQADVVEFHRAQHGVSLDRRKGCWLPVPVEYKRGKPKKNNCDTVQLCAQALCLEEMLTVCIPGGFLFYGKSRRRKAVVFDDALRQQTERLARDVRALFGARQNPPPVNDQRCSQCSLYDICLPAAPKGVGYLVRQIQTVLYEREGHNAQA